MIQIKRAYERPSPQDGRRVLVDRIWPRGLKKDALALESWQREAGPSHQLRRWFGHDPARWDEFKRRYRQELRESAKEPLIEALLNGARSDTLTLVYSARDTEHNQAAVLRDYLEERLRHS